MNFKVFSACFIALLVIHTTQQTPLKDDGIKEFVVAAFRKILETTGSVLTKADDLVDNLEKNKDEVVKKIVDSAVKEGQILNKDFLDLVDELKDGATAEGKSVLDCIDAEKDKTDAAFQATATDIGKCAGDEIPLIVKELKSVLGQLDDLQNDVQGDVNTLSACSDDELTCLMSFLGSASQTIKKIPSVVEDDIGQIVALVKQVISDVSGCDISEGIKKNVQDIFNEAVICIKK